MRKMKDKTGFVRRVSAGTSVAFLLLTAVGVAAAAPASASIWLYKDPLNFSANPHMDVGRGTSWVGADWNDKTSAVKIYAPANYFILYEHADWGGRYTPTFYQGVSDLRVWNFDDMTSSVG